MLFCSFSRVHGSRFLSQCKFHIVSPEVQYKHITFSFFFPHDYFQHIRCIYNENSVDLNTYAGYLSSAKSSVVPYFKEKGYTLRDLEDNPKFIQDYYSYEMYVVGLTSNTVIHRHANIRKCLQYAFQVGLIKSNPADRVERPQMNVFVSEYYDTQALMNFFRQ